MPFSGITPEVCELQNTALVKAWFVHNMISKKRVQSYGKSSEMQKESVLLFLFPQAIVMFRHKKHSLNL